jgi:hypothetical protein
VFQSTQKAERRKYGLRVGFFATNFITPSE